MVPLSILEHTWLGTIVLERTFETIRVEACHLFWWGISKHLRKGSQWEVNQASSHYIICHHHLCTTQQLWTSSRTFWKISMGRSTWSTFLQVSKDNRNINPSHLDPGRREKINLKFYYHTSLWYLKMFYEGLKSLHKTFWGTTKKWENENLS